MVSRWREGIVPLLSVRMATCGMAPGGEGCGEIEELAVEAAEMAWEQTWGGLLLLRGVEKLLVPWERAIMGVMESVSSFSGARWLGGGLLSLGASYEKEKLPAQEGGTVLGHWGGAVCLWKFPPA